MIVLRPDSSSLGGCFPKTHDQLNLSYETSSQDYSKLSSFLERGEKSLTGLLAMFQRKKFISL